ncbi:hypothetical protein NP493_3788g00000 [Ridgeia piscesae]|uniref:Uncharacterized protein n=1 Tax=Ridgeia piscesae TaxID=27915 RepID=A0AAD9MVX3_RIDPI|nr:hypothetical protein NP493_3788g00000 [Ridgeia piscesae]
MCSPLPLRLWCMAAMAPALTTEAATRARDTLTPPSQPSNGHGPVVNNGRVFSNSVLVDASCVLQPKSTVVSSTVVTGKSRIVTLPKEFILDQRQAHRPVVSRSLVVSGRNVINLGTISDLSKIYQSQRTAISVSATVNNVPQGMTMTQTSTMATNTSTAAGGKLLSLNITAAGLCGTGEGHSAQSTTKLSTQPVAGSHNSTLELSNGINILSHSRISTPPSITHCGVNKQTDTVFDTSRRQRFAVVRHAVDTELQIPLSPLVKTLCPGLLFQPKMISGGFTNCVQYFQQFDISNGCWLRNRFVDSFVVLW